MSSSGWQRSKRRREDEVGSLPISKLQKTMTDILDELLEAASLSYQRHRGTLLAALEQDSGNQTQVDLAYGLAKLHRDAEMKSLLKSRQTYNATMNDYQNKLESQIRAEDNTGAIATLAAWIPFADPEWRARAFDSVLQYDREGSVLRALLRMGVAYPYANIEAMLKHAHPGPFGPAMNVLHEEFGLQFNQEALRAAYKVKNWLALQYLVDTIMATSTEMVPLLIQAVTDPNSVEGQERVAGLLDSYAYTRSDLADALIAADREFTKLEAEEPNFLDRRPYPFDAAIATLVLQTTLTHSDIKPYLPDDYLGWHNDLLFLDPRARQDTPVTRLQYAAMHQNADETVPAVLAQYDYTVADIAAVIVGLDNETTRLEEEYNYMRPFFPGIEALIENTDISLPYVQRFVRRSRNVDYEGWYDSLLPRSFNASYAIQAAPAA